MDNTLKFFFLKKSGVIHFAFFLIIAFSLPAPTKLNALEDLQGESKLTKEPVEIPIEKIENTTQKNLESKPFAQSTDSLEQNHTTASSNWFWLGPLIIFLGILVNSFIFYLTISDRKKERRNALIDEFWIRQIILPQIQKISEEFSERHKKKWLNLQTLTLTRTTSISLSNYIDEQLSDDLHKIVLKLKTFKQIDSNLTIDFIDSLEESIIESCLEFEKCKIKETQNLIAKRIVIHLDQFTLDMMTKLMEAHIKYHDDTA